MSLFSLKLLSCSLIPKSPASKYDFSNIINDGYIYFIKIYYTIKHYMTNLITEKCFDICLYSLKCYKCNIVTSLNIKDII